MKQLFASLAGIFFTASLTMASVAAIADETEKPAFDNNRQITSYSVGVQTARTFVKDDVDIDIDQFIKGLKDASGGKPLLVTEEKLRSVLNGFQSDLRRNLKTKHTLQAAENIRGGKKFLEENKKKPGVIALPNGLQYRVIKEGDGKKPIETDTVTCNYVGTVINGSKFDASEVGKPVSLNLSQIIPGMRQALMLMPVGAHWQLFIPSPLAYGPRSVGADIGANETLIFDLELVSIK
jgi:FKBP-type peptidyl-prolyl cis-trans isomerase FklB